MNYRQLSQEERYHIAFLSKRRYSINQIALELNRYPSTISREFKRNRTHYDNGYRPVLAHSYATARRRRERRGSQFSSKQWNLVLSLLKWRFSPEQISNILKRYKIFSISHETIYKYLLHDKKKGGTWYKYLRIVPKKRKKRYNSYDSRGRLAGKRHISERPSHIEKRNRIGHWEGDTVIGKDRYHCIVTLVERKSGFVIIKKIPARTKENVTAACIKAIKEHGRKFKTITFDNGTEFHGYKMYVVRNIRTS